MKIIDKRGASHTIPYGQLPLGTVFYYCSDPEHVYMKTEYGTVLLAANNYARGTATMFHAQTHVTPVVTELHILS